MAKVICPGEVLIDFISLENGKKLVDVEKFQKKAGGAPANVATALVKLGASAEFVGAVGKDSFGKFLIETLNRYEVGTSQVIEDEHLGTTIAYVSIDENGERDFEFMRGADGNISPQQIDFNAFKDCKIIHLGSATALLGAQLYEVYQAFIEFANQHDKFISFDPNYRDALYHDKQELFVKHCKEVIKHVDLIKVSEEEGQIITGESDHQQMIAALHDLGAKIVTLTLGKEGSLVSIENTHKVESIAVKMVDSTGAGDAFIGALLSQIANLEQPKVILKDEKMLVDFTKNANKVGALTTTKLGALDSIPSWDEITA
ncbi:carbohydrate kinase [Turicibacter sp. TJ11]|uniref:carbohydrate kinase family protein n=1 Tax=Turicibacter sp. TJ11 TaxID=2806443 RepID=UPI001F35E76C|nr:carbohydrate kinase [Turicibacter sp. TJ11]